MRLRSGPQQDLPQKVTFDDVSDALERRSINKLVLGKSVSGPVYHDLEVDSPHLRFSARTGGGKSAFCRALLCQPLHDGDLVVALEVKYLSQHWMRGLPGTMRFRSIGTIHNALITLADLADERSEATTSRSAHPGTSRRIFLLCEDEEELKEPLAEYWGKIKPEDSKTPSPAVRALSSIVHLGRQANMHVITTGFPGVARGLNGQVMPILTGGGRPGRARLRTGDTDTEVQLTFMTSREARKYARAGVAYDDSVPLSSATGLRLSERGGSE